MHGFHILNFYETFTLRMQQNEHPLPVQLRPEVELDSGSQLRLQCLSVSRSQPVQRSIQLEMSNLNFGESMMFFSMTDQRYRAKLFFNKWLEL